MLRIETFGLTRGDPEETRVKTVDVLEESAADRALFGRRSTIRTLRIENADGVPASQEKLPERARARGARQTAAETHDGDGLAFFLFWDAHSGRSQLETRVYPSVSAWGQASPAAEELQVERQLGP